MRNDIPDYDLESTELEDFSPEAQPRFRLLWIVGGVLVALALIAAGILWYRRAAEPAATTPTAETRPVDDGATAPVGAAVPPLDLPPLDATDSIVRELVGKLSSHPRVAAWLATDGLIRSFAVVMTNSAEGRSPSGRLPMLRPAGPFRVMERGDDLLIDPVSYTRYDALASAIASLDPEDAARVFTQLKPRIDDAYRELGLTESIDQSVERAIRLILQTPVIDGPVRVEPKGIVYGFADERLEAMPAVQKQLMRLGPENLRIVQRQVRAIAVALGIPPDRLPS